VPVGGRRQINKKGCYIADCPPQAAPLLYSVSRYWRNWVNLTETGHALHPRRCWQTHRRGAAASGCAAPPPSAEPLPRPSRGVETAAAGGRHPSLATFPASHPPVADAPPHGAGRAGNSVAGCQMGGRATLPVIGHARPSPPNWGSGGASWSATAVGILELPPATRVVDERGRCPGRVDWPAAAGVWSRPASARHRCRHSFPNDHPPPPSTTAPGPRAHVPTQQKRLGIAILAGGRVQSALPDVPLRAATDCLWVDHRGCLSNLRQLTAKAGAGLQSRRRRARARRVGSMADGPWRSDTTSVSPTTTFVLVSSLDPTSKKFLQVRKNPISSGTDRVLGESNKFLVITVGDGWRIAPL